MMKIFYFTGTGNSLYVAQQLGGELLSIPQVMKDDRIEIQDEAVGIVCPIYAGDMPKMVHHFLERAKIETDYFFDRSTPNGTGRHRGDASRVGSGGKGWDQTWIMWRRSKWWTTIFQAFPWKSRKATAPEKKIQEQIDKACQDIAARKREAYPVTLAHKASMAMNPGRPLEKGCWTIRRRRDIQ